MNSDLLHLRTWSNPCEWLWFDSFYSHPAIMWNAQVAKHQRIVTMIMSPFKELDFFVFQATFEIWKGILSISVTKKKKVPVWCKNKSIFKGSLMCKTERHTGRFWRRSCLQQLPALFLNLTPQTEFLCEVDNHAAECISSKPCGFSINQQ